MIGLCCNSDHLRTVFYNSTVVNDTKCTVPLHGKKRHSQENVFWQFHLFYEMLLFYFVSGLIRMAFHTSLYEKRTRPMSLNSGSVSVRFQKYIKFYGHHHNIHAKIQPEHDQGNGCQASIHGKSIKIINIDGKPEGKNIPCSCTCRGSRKLAFKGKLCIRKCGKITSKTGSEEVTG